MTDERLDQHIRDVRDDHYLHWAATIGAAAYAWQLHGAFAAVGMLVVLIFAIAVTNAVLIVKTGKLNLVRANRWAWVILAFAFLALSSVSGGRV